MTKAHIRPNLAPLGEAPLSPSAGASRPSAPPGQVLLCQVLLPHPLPLPPLPSATQGGPREQSLPLPPFEPDFCMPRPWQPSGLASASGICCSSWRIAPGLLEPALPLIRGELVSPGMSIRSWHTSAAYRSIKAFGKMLGCNQPSGAPCWTRQKSHPGLPSSPVQAASPLPPSITGLPWEHIFNKSLAHKPSSQSLCWNPDLLTFEQSGASGKTVFSILHGQGRGNL